MDKMGMESLMCKIHGRSSNRTLMANQGASEFLSADSKYNNPFASAKQRKYLFANKPEVAKKFAKHTKKKH